MSIVYIPLVKREGGVSLERSLPSPLAGKISQEEWEEIMGHLSHLLSQRTESFLMRILGVFLLGSLIRKHFLSRIDREIERYLDKKNLVLKKYGITVHHPKGRAYSGLDVSLHVFLPPYIV